MRGDYAENGAGRKSTVTKGQFLLDIKTIMVIYLRCDSPPRHISDRLLRHERGTILLKKLGFGLVCSSAVLVGGPPYFHLEMIRLSNAYTTL
jgi:hypothetical protein